MKLNVDVLRYLSKDDFRVLTAVEMGMRNHEIVPSELISRIAALKNGGTYKVLKNLLKHKLLHHDSSKYDGFRLTYLGYDFLAIKTLVNRGVISSVGRQLGVGKESDIFEVAKEDGTVLAMKLHRLGRVSFRAVKSKRDYLRHRSSYNWLYLSRLAALKEFAFMKALEEHGFPVPNAVDCNRHCVIMSLVQGYPLVQVKQLQNYDVVFETIIGLVIRLAEHGLIHCDFNEFNIMIDDDENITMIDFPQMVSVSHRNAQMYFDRDVECIFKFFRKRFNMSYTELASGSDSDVDEDVVSRPNFSSIQKTSGFLDKELAASGFSRKDQEDIEKAQEIGNERDSVGDESSDDEETIIENSNDINIIPREIGLDLGDEKTTVEEETSNDIVSSSLNDQEIGLDLGDERTSDKETANYTVSSSLIDQLHQTSLNDQSELENPDDTDEEDDEEIEQDSAELTKSLNKERRRAIVAAHRGKKNTHARNTYKAKGAKSSNNSKLQKQLSDW